MNRNRTMSPTMLRIMDWVMGSVVAVALFFLLYDMVQSMAKDIPVLGWTAYLTGPIFAHKLSELVIAGSWVFYAMLYNHERANLWPKWIGVNGYGLALRITAVAALLATIQATYAWTIINLGTSPLTTDFTPIPSLMPDETFVWRYYLGAVIAAGAAYTIFAGYKGVRILFVRQEVISDG